MKLEELGPRICILGPSNSGKSTLADAIARSHGLPAIHIDQLHFLPGTDWRPRSNTEFIPLHDEAIMAQCWVIDGNYSRCLPQRLARATGVIRLDIPTTTSLFRYFRRCWFERDRRGALEGIRDRVNWEMINHIAFTQRNNRKRDTQMFGNITLPKVELASIQELKRFYSCNGLTLNPT